MKLTFPWRGLFVCATILCLGFVLLLLAGCNPTGGKIKPLPSAPMGADAPLTATANATTSALTNLGNATATTDTAQGNMFSRLLANIQNAKGANAGNPDGPPKVVTDSELVVAESRLTGVTPDPVEVAAGEQRKYLVEQGRAEEARKSYAQANDQARALSLQLQAAKTAETQANQALAIAIARQALAEQDYVAKAEKAKKDTEAAIAILTQKHKDALDAKDSKVMKDQIKWLNVTGVSLASSAVLLLSVAWLVGSIVALRKAAPVAAGLFVLSLCAFGMAQILGLWWVKWASLTIVIGVLVACAVWGYRMAKKGKLESEVLAKAEDLKDKAVLLSSIVTNTVPTLDAAWDNVVATGNVEGQKLLRSLIFSPLKEKNDLAEKKAIRMVRAGELKIQHE